MNANYNKIEIALFQTNDIVDPKKFVDIGFHSHNTIEITYMVSGTLEFDFDINGKIEHIVLLRKQMCICMPNIVHKTTVTNPLCSIGAEFATIDKSDIKEFIRNSSYCSTFSRFNKFNLDSPYIIINDNGNLKNILDDLYKYSDRSRFKELDKGKLDLKIREFYLEILDCAIVPKEMKKSNIIMNKSKEYIENNYFRDIKAPDVAKAIDVSYSYLRSLYKKELNTTINEVITFRRIEESKLLIQKGYSIEKISKDTGFKTVQYFDKIFKEYVGITPTQFKNNIEVKQTRYIVINNPNLYSFLDLTKIK